VPPENSLLFAMACRKAGVPVELHLYMKGEHGLALANELTQAPDGSGLEPACESWMQLAYIWMMGVRA
jgi:acetyl esterase/lipase